MGFFDSISTAAGKVMKTIATAANTAMETVTKKAENAKIQLENTAAKFKNDFKVFCIEAPCIIKKTFLDLRDVLYIKVRHTIDYSGVVLPPVILHLVGFTATGIAAGSIAAVIQASIGSVAAGSTFAVLTSAMMGGYGVAIVFGWIASSYVAAVLGILIWKRFSGGQDDEDGKGSKED